jgi:hypothetical protein
MDLRNTMTPEMRAEVVRVVNDIASGHDQHTWMQIGRCVYSVDCNKRLYQGTIPESHEKVKTPRRWDEAADPAATRKMREHWGRREIDPCPDAPRRSITRRTPRRQQDHEGRSCDPAQCGDHRCHEPNYG